jgi:hypothetical protein
MAVIMGGETAFDAILYGNQNANNSAYFQDQINRLQSVAPAFGNNNYFQNTINLYNKINSHDVLRVARAALNAVSHTFQPNSIRYADSLNHMQAASPIMQRYIMANPAIRNLYQRQEIDGYSESYVDLYPGEIKDNHYDYRRVMNGVLDYDNEVVRFYPDELSDNDRELNHYEKDAILSTWELAELFLSKTKNDPTDLWNNTR